VALRWRDRWKMVREDVRMFRRSIGTRALREQLVARRQALVAEFDSLARRWQVERLGQD
jgi:hypothetical protein